MTAAWYRREACGDLIISLHIQPGAKRTEIAGRHGGALKIRLAAPPVDGRANASLAAFLAQQLDVPPSRVTLLSGAGSRQKRLRISAPPAQALAGFVAKVEKLG